MIPASHPSLPTGLILVLLFCALLCVPAVSAVTLTPGSSTTTTIAQGDPVYIRGIATGQPQAGLQVWFIGYNFAKVSTVQINDDDSYEYELQKVDTTNLAAGQYFVLVQHPMMNGQFDVIYDASTGTVKNVQTGKTVYRFTGSGSLQSTDSATALMQAVNSQNIDDTFASVSFYVGQPAVAIRPIGDRTTGDKFTINGTTSLAPGDKLTVDITSSSFRPTSKNAPSGFSGASGTVAVVAGSGGKNTWSFDVDASSFTPDEYIVKVSAVEQDATASATFNVLCSSSGDTCGIPVIAANTTVAAPGAVTTAAPSVSTTVITTTGSPATTATTKASLPAAASVLGLVAAAGLLRKKLK